jgi:hypothetical protein
MTLADYYATQADRCSSGRHAIQHPRFCQCTELTGDSEWHTFLTAIRTAVRPDGSVHQCDVRPIIRGRIEPKHIGQMWRRARTTGLVRDTGEREPSNDVVGRNADKLDRIYALEAAA